MTLAQQSNIFKLYWSSVWLLMCIIVALIVVQFPLHDSREQMRIENEKVFENFDRVLQSMYWGANSGVWWFRARAQLSYCSEYFLLQTLQSSFALPCLPQSVPKFRKFESMNILGIDATFADDAVDFVDVRRFFINEWVNFYSAQSSGRFPGSWVIRTSSKFIFWGKKTLYIFYNERKWIPRYKRSDVIRQIKNHFPGLDEVQLHSFFYYKKVLWDTPFDSSIGRLMYYIWDCDLPEHDYCENDLTTDGKYKLFTQQMITRDLDFFFIIPAHWGQSDDTRESNGWATNFLQWLFKSPN